MMINPEVMVMGKPIVKTFNWGAARVKIPKVIFTNSMAVMGGNDKTKAVENIQLPHKNSFS